MGVPKHSKDDSENSRTPLRRSPWNEMIRHACNHGEISDLGGKSVHTLQQLKQNSTPTQFAFSPYVALFTLSLSLSIAFHISSSRSSPYSLFSRIDGSCHPTYTFSKSKAISYDFLRVPIYVTKIPSMFNIVSDSLLKEFTAASLHSSVPRRLERKSPI